VIPSSPESHIISDYCIGAVGKVASVMLYSKVPLTEISKVLLDYQSRTSVTLVKVLAQNYWKIGPQWIKAEADYETLISGTTAAVIIGDRTFGIEDNYEYVYDLAEEWQKFTQLPFVFACWVSNKQIDDAFISSFNQALKTGLDARTQIIPQLQASGTYKTDVQHYLTKSIDYVFDQPKKQALELFLSYMGKLT
jgi:chorismate dehydratase